MSTTERNKGGRPAGPAKDNWTIRATPAAKVAARKLAFRRNLSVSQLLEELIRRECATYLPAEESAVPAAPTAA